MTIDIANMSRRFVVFCANEPQTAVSRGIGLRSAVCALIVGEKEYSVLLDWSPDNAAELVVNQMRHCRREVIAGIAKAVAAVELEKITVKTDWCPGFSVAAMTLPKYRDNEIPCMSTIGILIFEWEKQAIFVRQLTHYPANTYKFLPRFSSQICMSSPQTGQTTHYK